MGDCNCDCSACDASMCFQCCYLLGKMLSPRRDGANCCGAGEGSCCCCDGLAKHLICVCAPPPDGAPAESGLKVRNTAWLVVVTVLVITALLASLLSLKFGLL